MDTQTIWLLVASVAPSIAGVVAFAIQLRQVKKSRLENEKLQLEISTLKEAARKSQSRIVAVTTDEILQYGVNETRLSRARTHDHAAALPNVRPKHSIRNSLEVIVVGGFLILIIAYGLYDIYRLVEWLMSKL